MILVLIKSYLLPPPPEIHNKNQRTIDFWVYIKYDGFDFIFFYMGDLDFDHSNSFGIRQFSYDNIYINHGNLNEWTSGRIESNNWYHLAFVFDGHYEYLFLNGKIIYKKKYNLNTSGNYLSINGMGDNYTSHGETLYDEFRISSVARWTEDFIPPKHPYIKLDKIFLDKQNFIYGITNKI